MQTPSIEQQNKILKRALFKMGKYCRQNPPLEIDNLLDDEMSLLKILCGGKERDPEGKEYVYYFVGLATKELEEE